jgi:hypothetical protein
LARFAHHSLHKQLTDKPARRTAQRSRPITTGRPVEAAILRLQNAADLTFVLPRELRKENTTKTLWLCSMVC